MIDFNSNLTVAPIEHMKIIYHWLSQWLDVELATNSYLTNAGLISPRKYAFIKGINGIKFSNLYLILSYVNF